MQTRKKILIGAAGIVAVSKSRALQWRTADWAQDDYALTPDCADALAEIGEPPAAPGG